MDTELFPPEVYKKVKPEVWADSTPGRAKNAWPIYISVKGNAGTPNLKLHPVRQEA